MCYRAFGHGEWRRRLLPLAALYAGGAAAVICAVWAYAIQPDRPAPRAIVPIMEFVVPSQDAQPLLDPMRVVPAIQRQNEQVDIMQATPLEA